MLGEGYHNNHHKFGGRANFGGVRWHEIDVVTLHDYVALRKNWVGLK